MLDTERITNTTPAVELLQISKKFGRHEVLKDISLKVIPGETGLFLGPSGSGKSTLLRCINFLEKTDSGEVFIHGTCVARGKTAGERALSEAQLAKLRMRVSMVFQHFNLWPHMTVLGNVIEAPIHVQKRPRSQVIAEAEELLDKVGLLEKRDVYPARLSGGQKQRVAIARALVNQLKLVICDEPVSMLDASVQAQVLDLMLELKHEFDLTYLFITHDLWVARFLCDRIAVMNAGKIVELGTTKQIFEHPQHPYTQTLLQAAPLLTKALPT